MIKDALMEKTGLDITRRRISERAIRELGRYEVPVRMGEVSPTLQIVVLREEEVAAYLNHAKAPGEEIPSDAAEAATASDVIYIATHMPSHVKYSEVNSYIRSRL